MKAKRPVSSRSATPVKVNLSYNELTGRMSIRPKTAVIKRRKKQEVIWRSRNADFEICLKPDDTPFHAYRYRCPEGGGCLSGVPHERKGREQLVRYTVRFLEAHDGDGFGNNGKAKKTTAKKKRCPEIKEAFLVLE